MASKITVGNGRQSCDCQNLFRWIDRNVMLIAAVDRLLEVAKWLSKMPESRSEARETFTVTVVAPELNQHRSNRGQRLLHLLSTALSMLEVRA